MSENNSEQELVICIDFPDALFYLIVQEDRVVEAAPKAYWAMGKSWSKKVKPWFIKKGAKVIEMTKQNNSLVVKEKDV